MGLQDRSVVAEKGCTRVFVGTFEHGLDEKGRLILPSAFRDAFATGGSLTKSLEGCLALMGEAEFQAQYEHRMRLASAGRVARNAARAFMAGSVPIVPDKQGRIAIPAKLREFADLDRTCVVNGFGERIEIWSDERWAVNGAEGDEALLEGDEAEAHLQLMLREDSL